MKSHWYAAWLCITHSAGSYTTWCTVPESSLSIPSLLLSSGKASLFMNKIFPPAKSCTQQTQRLPRPRRRLQYGIYTLHMHVLFWREIGGSLAGNITNPLQALHDLLHVDELARVGMKRKVHLDPAHVQRLSAASVIFYRRCHRQGCQSLFSLGRAKTDSGAAHAHKSPAVCACARIWLQVCRCVRGDMPPLQCYCTTTCVGCMAAQGCQTVHNCLLQRCLALQKQPLAPGNFHWRCF